MTSLTVKRIRKNFGKIRSIVKIPDLIGMQRDSYWRFLQADIPPEKRREEGLQTVFNSVFPIRDFTGSASLEFVSYRFEKVKHSVEECIHRGMTHDLPVKITVRLVVYDVDKERDTSTIRDIKEQEIYFGAIPLMTERGTFIINGTERVVVSQLHRSSGVFFSHDKGKTHSSGKVIYSSRIIPVRGSWIDMEVDPTKDVVYIKIDKRRKFPVTLLFKACGFSSEDILSYFYKTQTIYIRSADTGHPAVAPDSEQTPDTPEPEVAAEAGQTADLIQPIPGSYPATVADAPPPPPDPEPLTPDPVTDFAPLLFFEEFGEFQKGRRATRDITDPVTGETVVKEGRIFTQKALRHLHASGVKQIPTSVKDLEDRTFSLSVIHPKTGDPLVNANDAVTPELLLILAEAGVTQFSLTFSDNTSDTGCIRKTLLLDKLEAKEDALLDIYRRLRPGNPATSEVAQDFIDQMFFRTSYYDLSGVGRMKLNLRLGIDIPVSVRTLRREDILLTVKTLVRLRDAQGPVDDIDHLGNRRVRAVGELLENQYRVGLVRMERAIRERMSLQEVDALMPNDLVNPKPVSAVVKEFFGTSQLSQFMDQTNPLSETTHKRRLSALGPGGLTRERAGFEVRDVHPSHYGRICPIETPEGPNIGLIVSLSTYARVNRFGFIETPYTMVKDSVITEEVRFLSAFEEKNHPIAQANAPLEAVTVPTQSIFPKARTAEFPEHQTSDIEDQTSDIEDQTSDIKHQTSNIKHQTSDSRDKTSYRFRNSLVTSRVMGEFMMTPREDIELMDISPNQLVSVSASLIPFLENDDANRALMGSNMQRQAVPLVTPRAPLVGTGIEGVVAKDSGVTLVSPYDAEVVAVDASRIVLRPLTRASLSAAPASRGNSLPDLAMLRTPGSWETTGTSNDRLVTIFNLSKFTRSNQNTCFNQRPIVSKGQQVEAGDIIADGPSTEKGELALGKNITVAFMPWGGYNFEDSILVSENLAREGVYTSVHIEEFEIVARDTKLGKEEITRDIPNVGEDALRDLDESGIVCLGAEVAAGSILVGKVTPKGETQLSPEEKLLRAIFGEKAGDVKDTSLRIPPGVEGIVTDAKVFSRRGIEKDDRARIIEDQEIAALEKDRDDELGVLAGMVRAEMKAMVSPGAPPPVLKKLFSYTPLNSAEVIILSRGSEIVSRDFFDAVPVRQLEKLVLEDPDMTRIVRELTDLHKKQHKLCMANFERRVSRYEKGDDLPPGVNKMVKVYVAMKRKLSVGDKMAGRHGNKGVVSRILPQEDMPYFEDGTTIDMVLNPLGVPSRMNVGQILEIHLGYAAKGLGDQLTQLVREVRAVRERAGSEPPPEEDLDVAFPYSESVHAGALRDAHDSALRVLREKLRRIFTVTRTGNLRTEPAAGTEPAATGTEPAEVRMIDSLREDELLNFAEHYKDGVHMATPVFDGAKEDEIRALLREGGLRETAQTTLYDGRTGEPFNETVTVGTMYMLKLHHLVDDKIHARSIGPYSLVTQQPLGGKAQFGGQRLGEMEVWAMEAYGAAHSLQEFLTVKSDDMAGRTRMYEKIVKGQNVLEPGIPESFNVLTKELQALGLQVILLEE